jgi:hypothetical protein
MAALCERDMFNRLLSETRKPAIPQPLVFS